MRGIIEIELIIPRIFVCSCEYAFEYSSEI